MNNPKNNENSAYDMLSMDSAKMSTISINLTHPHGLNHQEGIEWVIRNMEKEHPDFIVEFDPSDDDGANGGWPFYFVSGEHFALQKWYCNITGTSPEDEWQEWRQPYTRMQPYLESLGWDPAKINIINKWTIESAK